MKVMIATDTARERRRERERKREVLSCTILLLLPIGDKIGLFKIYFILIKYILLYFHLFSLSSYPPRPHTARSHRTNEREREREREGLYTSRSLNSEEREIRDSISSRWLKEQLELKREEEEKHLHMRFKAMPVPSTTTEPLVHAFALLYV